MRSQKLYDGKPYKLALNREGYYELRWTGADGKTKQRSTSERDLNQAGLTAEILWRDLNQIVVAGAKFTVSEICEQYLANCANRQTTIAQHYALKPVMEILGHLSDHPLSDSTLDLYVSRRRRQGRNNASIRRELGGLKAALRFGVKRRLILAEELPFFELPPSSLPRNNPATLLEIDEIWALALDASPLEGQGDLKPITLFTTIAVATGARRGAVLELPWGQVEWNGAGGRIMLNFASDKPSANRNKRRGHVPVSKKLEPILRRAFREALDRAGLAGVSPIKTPEIIKDLRVCGVRYIEDQWRNLIKQSQKPNLKIHDLRHTWATNMIKAGASPVEVAYWLQDSLKTVMANYVHLTPGYLIDVADKLELSKG